MPTATVADAIGLVGVTLSTLATWAQYSRARRYGVDGISLLTWFQFILMGLFWISYGTAEHSPVIIAGSAMCLPIQLAIVAKLSPHRHPDHLLAGIVFVGTCCALPVGLFGWSAGALGCGVAMVINRLPQIVKLLRHPGDIGVSVASWMLGAACSVAWIGYYLFSHLWAALTATVAGMVGNLVIAALATWRHHQVEAVVELVGPLPGAAEDLGYVLQLQG